MKLQHVITGIAVATLSIAIWAGLNHLVSHARAVGAASAPQFLPAGAVVPSADFLTRADAYKRYVEQISEDCRKGHTSTLAEETICEQVLLNEIQSAIPKGMQYDPTYRALLPLPSPPVPAPPAKP